jgi:hypothetical protein
MKEAKDWKKWPDAVSLQEIEKLLRFIPKWDGHFRGKDPEKFSNVYSAALPVIKELEHEKLETAKLDAEQLQKISKVFDALSRYSEQAYESTDCSKILHTILPDLIVMWDREIRKGIVGNENRKEAEIYAFNFLPKMQIELKEAIGTCMEAEMLGFEEAARYIRKSCGFESLPKLIDEHNYVIYTRLADFRFYLESLKQRNEIRNEDCDRLKTKLPRI